MADDHTSSAALYRLMAWLSPSYPVGAFSYSSGIEWAVEAGDIKDADSLRRWLAIVVGEGGLPCEQLADTGQALIDLGKQVPVNTILDKAIEVGADGRGEAGPRGHDPFGLSPDQRPPVNCRGLSAPAAP